MIRRRRTPTRIEINVIAFLCLSMSLFLFGYIIFQFSTFRADKYVGTFHCYENIEEPAPSLIRPTRTRKKHLITVNGQEYSITKPVYSYFNEGAFLKDVREGSEIVLHLDQNNNVVGIQTNEKSYLSILDAKKALFNDRLKGVISAFFIGGIAILLFLIANHKKFQQKTYDWWEKAEGKWNGWIKRRKYWRQK